MSNIEAKTREESMQQTKDKEEEKKKSKVSSLAAQYEANEEDKYKLMQSMLRAVDNKNGEMENYLK